MSHFDYVGHFECEDLVDMTSDLYKPKVRSPIPLEAIERALRAFGENVEPHVCYNPKGFVTCHWSDAGGLLGLRVRAFAFFLAEAESAMLITERFVVEIQPSAQSDQPVILPANLG